MRYLLLGLILLTPFAVSAARFDFTNGQPSVTDDGEIGDTFEKTRYDFTNGQPTPVLDSTATEEVVTPTSNDGEFINNGGRVINYGGVIIQ